MRVNYNFEKTKDSGKPVDAWWTVSVIDPVAFRITWIVANFTSITPNLITLVALLLGILASYFYFQGDHRSLVIAALIFESSFLFDCVDGKLARLKNTGTKFGAYWDFVQDRLIQFVALFALIWGQYQISADINIIWLGLIYIFADSFHRVLAFHISSVRFRFGEEYFQRKDKDQLRDELSQYEESNNNNWKSGIKRWMWTRRLAILPTTIEARVLLFFFAAIFNQVFLGLLLSASLLLGLSILRSILTVKRLYSHPDTNK